MVSVVAACYLLGGVVLVMFLGSCCCASCVWCMQQVAALAFLFVCPAIVSWCLCTASVSSCLCTESVSSVCIQYKFTGWCAKKSNFGFIDPDVLGKLNQVCLQPTLIFLFFFSLIFCFINDIPLNCECSQHSSPPCSSSLESYGWCSCNGPNQSRFESSYKASDISGQPWKEIMVSPVFWTLIFFLQANETNDSEAVHWLSRVGMTWNGLRFVKLDK